jgi:hypothetical protein
MKRGTLLALLLIATLAGGCARAIFSIVSFRTHEAYTDASLTRFRELLQSGETVGKSDVMATLGPPIEVIGQDEGEVFVYRRLARDTNVINLNPAMISFVPAPPVPIYYGSDSSGRDDTLMLFFDREGWLRNTGERLGIAETDRSRAALLGEGVQELIK